MRRDYTFLPPFISIILLLSTLSYGQAWSGVVAPSRAIDWSQAGLPATLPDGETTPNPWTPPTRTQCGSTVNPSGDTTGATDTTNINHAISGCTTAGTYVLLSSGTFYVDGTIVLFGRTSISLRGSGAQNTKIKILGGGAIQIGEAWGGSSAPLTSGSNYAAGSTTITINTSSPPTTGNLAWLTQCDTGTSGNPCSGTQVDNNSVFVCGDTGSGICQYDSGAVGTPMHQFQYVWITSVTSLGSNNYSIGISPGLYMPNWAYALTPMLNWQDAAHIAVGMGLEDFTMEFETSATSGSAYQMAEAYASWTKGVRFVGNPPNRVVSVGPTTKNCLFMNNYIYAQNPSAFSSGYGTAIQQGSDSDDLILNNIIQGAMGIVGGGKDEGVVEAYNYARDIDTTLYSIFEYQHTASAAFILREGNQMGSTLDDDTWGTHNFDAWFRNYYSGYDPPYVSTSPGGGDPTGIKIDSYARFENAVGNVIWGPMLTNYVSSANYIFYFGSGSDSLNQPTSMRWGNCDSATSTCRFVNSEVPSSLASPNASYSNPVPSTTTLPATFFMSGVTAHSSGGTGLSWWKVCTSWTTFPTSCGSTQTQPFPAAGPDVTGGPYANGYAYDIPASLAYQHLPVDTSYQNSYTITGSSWSNGTETLTVSGLPSSSEHIMGGFQISGGNCATSGAGTPTGAEVLMTGSSTTTISYALASNPGSCASGTVEFPDVRQFDESVYQNDSGGGDPSVNPPTGLSAVVN